MGSNESLEKEAKQFVRYSAEMIKKVLGVDTLVGANLRRADLRWADLGGADLRGADLYEANLQNANLQEANLQDVDMRGVNLWDTDLRNTKNLTLEQLSKTFIDETTILPDGQTLDKIQQAMGVRVQKKLDRRLRARSKSPRWGMNRRTTDREDSTERRGADRRVHKRRRLGYNSVF